MNYFFVDTETGGLTLDCSVLSIGWIITDGDFNILTRRYALVKRDSYTVSPEAMAINKLDLAFCKKYGLKPEGIATLLETDIFKYGAKVKLTQTGANPKFDKAFIEAQILKMPILNNNTLDLWSSARMLQMCGLIPNSFEPKSGPLFKHLGIDVDLDFIEEASKEAGVPFTRSDNFDHHALADCQRTLFAFRKMKQCR